MSHTTLSRRVVFVLTSHDRKGDQPSGFYLSEATHPHKILAEAGYQIDFVSPKGGKAPIDGFDLDDPVNAAFWNDDALRHQIEHTKRPSEIDATAYAAIFYAGGHAAMWDLPDNAEIAAIAASIYDRGGVVGAVCHGSAGLVNVRLASGAYLVAGKDVSAFTNDEERAVQLDQVVPFLLADRLVERGARHLPAPNFQRQLVVSERLVTGQNPASAASVAESMLALLRARDARGVDHPDDSESERVAGTPTDPRGGLAGTDRESRSRSSGIPFQTLEGVPACGGGPCRL